MPLNFAAAGAVALFAVYKALISGTKHFVPAVCDHNRLDHYLKQNLVGQELAVLQLVEAVCNHISIAHPSKPLVISVHGPPGVGKTYTHTLLAKALYNGDPAAAEECPGRHCQGYRVVYGVDYTADAQAQQLSALRESLMSHLSSVGEALLVIEEYDKMDCASRAMMRQLISNPATSNGTFNKAILMFESNLGFSELEQMLQHSGGRERVSAESAERVLKEIMFKVWMGGGCESFEDAVKFSSLVDFYLPYFPLERPHIAALMNMTLAARAGRIALKKRVPVLWDPHVLDWLVDKVHFDGPYPLEGARAVNVIATRYVARVMRQLEQAQIPHTPAPHSSPSTSSLTSSFSSLFSSASTPSAQQQHSKPAVMLYLADSSLKTGEKELAWELVMPSD